MTTVQSSKASLRTFFKMASVSASMLEVASSRITILLCCKRARARERSWFWPVERVVALCSSSRGLGEREERSVQRRTFSRAEIRDVSG